MTSLGPAKCNEWLNDSSVWQVDTFQLASDGNIVPFTIGLIVLTFGHIFSIELVMCVKVHLGDVRICSVG